MNKLQVWVKHKFNPYAFALNPVVGRYRYIALPTVATCLQYIASGLSPCGILEPSRQIVIVRGFLSGEYNMFPGIK